MQIAIAKTDGIMVPLFKLHLAHGDDEESLEKLKSNLKQADDLLAKHATDYPYAWNTPDPTFLDFHLYVFFSRVLALEGSAYDAVYQKLNFKESYPHIDKLVTALRAREDLAPALFSYEEQHTYLAKQITLPLGEKQQLFLPL